MASTASTLLKIELQATGENSSTWGTKANTAMSRLEEAIADITNVSLATLGGAGYTLDDTQYAEHVDGSNTSESHVAAIKATGVLSAAEQITVPLRNKVYWVWNATTGSFAVTVGGATGTTIEVPQGSLMAVICDGTNVVALTRAVTIAGALATALAVAEGGTGATTAAGARTNLGLGALATLATVDTAQIADDAVDPTKAIAGVNAQTGTTYTYALTDNLKTVAHSNGSAIAATIPTNASIAFVADETRIDIMNEGAGDLTISGDTGVTVNGVSAGSFTVTQYQGATIIKRGTDTWLAPNQTVA